MGSTDIVHLPPREPFRVIGSTHALKNELRQVEVPAGATIAEALEISLYGASFDWPRDHIVASVGGVRIPREHWHHVRPKPGTTVVFRPVAGGDDTLRSLLIFGVAIAALFLAGPIGFALGGFFSTAAGTALIGGVITLAGALLINALIPIRPPQIDNEQGKSLPMLAGAQNEARPWGSVPVVLGRHRVSPMYAALPYTFFVGQKQYLNLLFCVGYGPLEITQIRIGDTLVSNAGNQPISNNNFDDIVIETREGRALPEDAKITIFPRTVNEKSVGVNLRNVDDYVTRTIENFNTWQISLDFIALQGIYIYNSKTGTFDNRPVTISVEYRETGTAGAWIGVDENGKSLNVVFTRTRDTTRLGARWLPAGRPKRYDIRCRKVTADYTGTAQVAEAIQWSVMRSFEHEHPISFKKPLALLALRARATDQFNGIINTLNVVAFSYVNSWNKTTWVPNVLSTSPADMFMHVLTGPANARPRLANFSNPNDPTNQVDFDSIQRWGDDCIDNQWVYNAVISDRRTVRDVLSDIAAAGRATVAMRNGRWGVSFPRDGDPVSWHFTPRNSSGMKSVRLYEKQLHALRVRYINAKLGWRQVEEIVYNDVPNSPPGTNYTADNATLFEQVEFPGQTHVVQVRKMARYAMAQARLRPETHTINADIESLRLERGDKVMLSTDVLLIGTGYGRVTSVNAPGESITVDSRVIMVSGKTYQIKFTLTNGTFLTRTVLNTNNETDVIFFDPADTSSAVPAVGNLFSFGETSLVTNDYRVLDVRPGPDFTAQLQLVDNAEGIDYSGDIPDYDPTLTIPPDPFDMKPEGLAFSERFTGSGITAKATIQLIVQIPRVGTIRAFEFQAKDVDANGEWMPFAVISAPHIATERDNLESGSWNFRVRALFAEDVTGATHATDTSLWVESGVVSVLSAFSLPPDVINMGVTIFGDVARLTWDQVFSLNFAYYRVKYSSLVDGTATWGGSVELLTTHTNNASSPARSGTYMVKAVTYAEIESANPSSRIIVTGNVGHENIVTTITESGLSPAFPGVHSFTQAQGALLTLAFQSGGGNYTLNQGFYQFASTIDLGSVYTSRITANVVVSGQSVGDTMDHWVTLASVIALDTSDPSSWSIEMVYITSNGPNPKSVIQLITAQGLTSGLKLCLEAGTLASWPGSGQKWLDESGGGYDFFLGSSGTASPTDPAEPTFNGTAGSLYRTSYWGLDGADYFTYDTTPEAWMDSFHQNNALGTVVALVYIADVTVTQFIIGNFQNSAAKIGWELVTVGPLGSVIVNVANGSGTVFALGTVAAQKLNTPGWHVIGVSFDEAAGATGGVFVVDGVANTFNATYASPSAAAATHTLQIACAGNTAAPMPAGGRVHSIAMWQGVVLTSAQLLTLTNAMLVNDDNIWDTAGWKPFAVTDVTARIIAFGIRLNGSVDGLVTPAVSQLSVTIDMPDLHLGFHFDDGAGHGSGTSPSGFSIAFNPSFKYLKDVTVANLNLAAGDYYQITARSVNGVTIIFKNSSNVVIDRTFDLHAYGYGEVVT